MFDFSEAISRINDKELRRYADEAYARAIQAAHDAMTREQRAEAEQQTKGR